MIVAQNGHVFFNEISEERIIGGLEGITAADNDSRYKTGVVVSAAEGLPLQEGDKFIYSWRDAFNVYADDDMHQVVNYTKIIAKIS